MKKLLLFFLTTVFLFSCGNDTKVNLILDTDLGPDYDDVGAMALMHALADSGKVNILGVMSSNKDERVIPCIDVLNTYFGRPDIPLGAPKSEGGVNLTAGHKEKWTDYLPANYPHRIRKTSDAPDAIAMYRRILSKQPDKSVVICTVGFFTNLKDLLLSEGDEFTPLTGRELVARKVKHLVSMAAHFPVGREFNVYCDAPASVEVVTNWPTEIIFSGFEIGDVILTGKTLVKADIGKSPVKDTYELCFKESDPYGRMSWDQTAVLVAINGWEPYYDTERGRLYVSLEGSNNWKADPEGRHIRLLEKKLPREMELLIENYMMHQPVKK